MPHHFFIHICWVCVLMFISLLQLLFVVGIDILIKRMKFDAHETSTQQDGFSMIIYSSKCYDLFHPFCQLFFIHFCQLFVLMLIISLSWCTWLLLLTTYQKDENWCPMEHYPISFSMIIYSSKFLLAFFHLVLFSFFLSLCSSSLSSLACVCCCY